MFVTVYIVDVMLNCVHSSYTKGTQEYGFENCSFYQFEGCYVDCLIMLYNLQ